MQVEVQSIKWISCTGMYKGYLRVLLYEPSGDPAKQFCNISGYFLRENLIMFSLTWKSICRCIHYQRRNGSCSTWPQSLNGFYFQLYSLLYRCYTGCDLVLCFSLLSSSLLAVIMWRRVHQSLVPLQSCVNPHRDFKQPLFHHTDWQSAQPSTSAIPLSLPLHLCTHSSLPPRFQKPEIRAEWTLFLPAAFVFDYLHTCTHHFLNCVYGCASVSWRVGSGGVHSDQWHPGAELYPPAHWQCFSHLLTTAVMGGWAGSCPGLKAAIFNTLPHTEQTL